MSNNKRIAKNTVFLYFRMALTMIVALYTSRIVLDVLGTSDYGLYNVVGGIVSMLGFLNGSISAGTSRFITYELGLGNKEKLRDVFNVSLVCHIVIAILIFVIAETIGLWFLNTQIVFDEDRMFAVNVIYQLSILTTMLQFTQIPYSSDIIAHEEMSVYAYISILEVALKLGMVFLLQMIHNADMLILYGVIIFLIQVIIIGLYRLYCLKKYEESRWRYVKDKQQYKQLFSFAGWDIVGALCVITQGQGVNVLLNMYFGPVVNAARAIAYQIQGAFSQFTGNFMTAVNPEIVKNFARKDYDAMIRLINNASVYSFYLLLLFMMPVMFKLNTLLSVWLKDVPEDTETFTLIILSLSMVRSLARPVIQSTHATGDIKALNLYAGGVGLLALPMAWLSLKLGAGASMAFWIVFIWGIFANILEIIIFKKNMRCFSIKEHLFKVYVRTAIVSGLAASVCFVINYCFDDSFLSFCFYYTLAFISTGAIVFYFGLTNELKILVIGKVKNAIHRTK